MKRRKGFIEHQRAVSAPFRFEDDSLYRPVFRIETVSVDVFELERIKAASGIDCAQNFLPLLIEFNPVIEVGVLKDNRDFLPSRSSGFQGFCFRPTRMRLGKSRTAP